MKLFAKWWISWRYSFQRSRFDSQQGSLSWKYMQSCYKKVIFCLCGVCVCSGKACVCIFSVCMSHYSTFIWSFMIQNDQTFSLPSIWNHGVTLVRFGIEESLPPPLPAGSLPVVMCWCSARGQCLFISLTSPIKIHSANEPSLSPPVIKTHCLICTRSHRQALCFHLAPLWLRYGTKHTLAYTRVTMQGVSRAPKTNWSWVRCFGRVHLRHHVVQSLESSGKSLWPFQVKVFCWRRYESHVKTVIDTLRWYSSMLDVGTTLNCRHHFSSKLLSD